MSFQGSSCPCIICSSFHPRGGFLLGSWTLGWAVSCFGQLGKNVTRQRLETPAHYSWPLLLPLEHGHHPKAARCPISRVPGCSHCPYRQPANYCACAQGQSGSPKAPSELPADDTPRRGGQPDNQTGPKQELPGRPIGLGPHFMLAAFQPISSEPVTPPSTAGGPPGIAASCPSVRCLALRWVEARPPRCLLDTP